MNIVVIHGFSSLPGKKRLKLLIEKIKEELPTARILVPEYLEKYSRLGIIVVGKKSIAEYAAICKKNIEGVKGPIFIIGYSSGGLITRVLIEKLGVEVKAAILVGTPNKGIKLNRWEKLLVKIIKRPVIEEMLAGSEFLQKLNQDYRRLVSSTKYYLLAGSKDKRVPIWSALAIEILQSQGTFIGSTNHSGLIPKKPKSELTAIDIIIKILKEEAGFRSASFLFIGQNLNFLLN